MKKTRGRKLTARGVQNLLNRISHRLDRELSLEFECNVYVLEDGGAVLVARDGAAVHWYSCEELISGHRDSLRRALERRDQLLDVQPQPERFNTDVPSLVAALPALLRIDASLLDFSERSLDALDSAIRRLGSERILVADVFPSLVAYVGEVIRRQVNGSWEVRTTREGTRHEPDIVDPTGGRYGLLRIYKQLLEYDRTASMRAFVHAALTTHRLLPRH